MDGYALFVDSHMRCALRVNETKKYTEFIMLDVGVVDVYRLEHENFKHVFRDELLDYPLPHYAHRMLNLQPDLGVIVTPSARAHLNNISHKEPIMAQKIPNKMEAPETKPKLVPSPAPKGVAKAPVTAPQPKAAKAPEEGGEEGGTKRPRMADQKIKKIANHTARAGTLRAAIMDAILSAKTTHEALATEVEHPSTGEGYKIKAVDVHFAVNNGWIELV